MKFEEKKLILNEEQKLSLKDNRNLEDNETIKNIIEQTVLKPIKALSYLESYNRNEIKQYPKEYYEQKFKEIDLENLDIAFSLKEFRSIILSDIHNYFENSFEYNNLPQQGEVAKIFSDIFIKYKDLLNPETYKKINPNKIVEQQISTLKVASDLTRALEYENLLEKDKVFAGLKEIVLNNINDEIAEGFIRNQPQGGTGSIPEFYPLYDFIFSEQNSKAFKSVSNIIENDFKKNDIDNIGRLFENLKNPSGKGVYLTLLGEKSANYIENRLSKYMEEKFNVSFKEVGKGAWGNSKKSSLASEISGNLFYMKSLEDALPGSVHRLNSYYKIKEFIRYPREILLSQLKEENINQPYGIVIFPREDKEDAFDEDYNVLKDLYAQILELNKQTGRSLGIKVFEVGSKRDIARIFIELDKKYGNENKISFVLQGGHGDENNIQLGNFMDNFNDNSISSDNLTGKGVKRVKDFFEPNPTIILFSCKTGTESGIGQNISREYDATVIAPEKSTSPKMINVSYDQNGKLVFDTSYYDKSEKNILTEEKSKIKKGYLVCRNSLYRALLLHLSYPALFSTFSEKWRNKNITTNTRKENAVTQLSNSTMTGETFTPNDKRIACDR